MSDLVVVQSDVGERIISQAELDRAFFSAKGRDPIARLLDELRTARPDLNFSMERFEGGSLHGSIAVVWSPRQRA